MFKFLFKKKSKDNIETSKYVNMRINLPEKSDMILIVDDSEINRDFLRIFLNRLGYTTKEASNGDMAIEMLCKDSFGLIYVDVIMPFLDGISMTRIVREMGYDKPIIGVTGNVDSDSIKKCKEAGMDTVLAKPVDIATIKHTTEHYLNNYEAKNK